MIENVMTPDFCEQLDVFTLAAMESEARLCLCDMSRGRIRSFHGELRGPRCAKAKTLQASFAVARCDCEADVSHSTSVLVTEPCYWTPELPMLYDLTLEIELADGAKTTCRQPIGLRRWEIHGRDFFRDGKRIVLRGAIVDDPSLESIQQAGEAEMTLLIRNSSDQVLQPASELGVPLVIDLRGCAGEFTPALLRLAWCPAVGLALLDEEPTSGFYQSPALKLGNVSDAAKPQAAGAAVCGLAHDHWADVIVFELAPGERPPAWAATVEKPVIAIRRGGTYPELAAARRGCDCLQAELAPEFDLAGYFV
jgi:hypothetical protein